MHSRLGSFALRAAFGLAAMASSGCAGLKLNLINSSVRRPSNVAVYFTVDRNNNDPVPGLTAERFRIYEDNAPVSPLESRQTILNPEVAAVHYTLLLRDMSGSVTESGQVAQLQAAAQTFTQRVERFQRVAIYAFDGSPNLTPIVPFTNSAGSASSAVSALAGFHPRDPSTNLYGAIVEALHQLEVGLNSATQPLRFGTLVVFTDGTDHAHRVSREDMMRSVRESPYDIFSIGIGSEIDAGELRDIGRQGAIVEQNQAAVQQAFEQIAQRIEGYTQRYYLLGYCSPSRAGEHDVRIEATTQDGASGSLTYHFNAQGFQPNCDPAQAPAFDTTLRNRPRNVGQPGH